MRYVFAVNTRSNQAKPDATWLAENGFDGLQIDGRIDLPEGFHAMTVAPAGESMADVITHVRTALGNASAGEKVGEIVRERVSEIVPEIVPKIVPESSWSNRPGICRACVIYGTCVKHSIRACVCVGR